MDKLKLAKLFHETYEGLAPAYGYETREDTKEFDRNTPNGRLMVAVCSKILQHLSHKDQPCHFCGKPIETLPVCPKCYYDS